MNNHNQLLQAAKAGLASSGITRLCILVIIAGAMLAQFGV
jgi:hypothetical protein